MSYGVPAEPAVLLHWAAVAQDGQFASLKQSFPIQPLVKAAIETNGATVLALSAFWVNPMRTSLPPLEPVSVMLKHCTGPASALFPLPPRACLSPVPRPRPHGALLGGTTVVPLLQEEPV